MNYLVNARFLATPTTGVGRVGRELLRAILEELATHPADHRPRMEIAAHAGAEVAGAAAAGVPLIVGPSNLPQEQALLPWLRPGATIISFANSTPLLARRSIIWIHDAHVFEAPENYSRLYRLWHQFMLRMSVLRGFRIVTVSNYSRQALIKRGANPDRIEVIYNGGDHILRETPDPEIAETYGLSKDSFVLLLGTRARHKNLPFAIEALVRHGPPDLKIVVVGLHQRGKYAGDQVLLDDPRVICLPRISDGALRVLYERARCVAIPSELEGFSLPAAEAMWCGAPLVLANRTALPEVGGEAAIFFEPGDAAGFVEAIMQASGPRRAALAEAAEKHRELFRWRDAARRFVDSL